MLNVTMTRIYAQVGPPILELYYPDPQKTLTTIFGTQGHPPASLTMFSLMYWYNRTDRGQPMAHQLASFHIGKSMGVAPRARKVGADRVCAGLPHLSGDDSALGVSGRRRPVYRRRLARDVLASGGFPYQRLGEEPQRPELDGDSDL
jgi:hypothetical protein